LSAWTLETTGADAGWQVTSFAPKTGALALHAVNATSGTLTDSAGPWESAISYAPVFVPFGAAEVYVTFKIQADFAADGCEHQEFSVSLNGANVVYEVRSGGGLFQAAEPCASTQGDFLEGRVSLGDTYNNESIELGFRLEVKGSDNSGHGVVIDDVQFQWSCAF
jgi:hypothetical protein